MKSVKSSYRRQLTSSGCFILADTPLAQTKVGEVGAWLARRDKTPRAVSGAISRCFWRWQHKYCQPKRAGIAPFFQVVVGSMIFFYAINYGKISEYHERPCYNNNNLTILFFPPHRDTQKLQVPLIGSVLLHMLQNSTSPTVASVTSEVENFHSSQIVCEVNY